MKIDILKICGKKTVTRKDGEKVFNILRESWGEEQDFLIDFNNILVASVSFMDEAFGRLAHQYTKEDIKKKIRFENIIDYDRALLNDILVSRFSQKELGENGVSFKRNESDQN